MVYHCTNWHLCLESGMDLEAFIKMADYLVLGSSIYSYLGFQIVQYVYYTHAGKRRFGTVEPPRTHDTKPYTPSSPSNHVG